MLYDLAFSRQLDPILRFVLRESPPFTQGAKLGLPFVRIDCY
ncbi:hypothetical protein ACVWXN_005900 [Bradyrhizobium sp. i1.4.4]